MEDEDFTSCMSASQQDDPEENTSTSKTSAFNWEFHIATQPLKGNPFD